jgi:hypothetical protein
MLESHKERLELVFEALSVLRLVEYDIYELIRRSSYLLSCRPLQSLLRAFVPGKNNESSFTVNYADKFSYAPAISLTF